MRLREGTAGRTAGILFAYFLIYVVWGSTYYLISVAMRGFPPFLLGALRFTAAGVILLLWCRCRGEDVFKKSLIRKSAVSGIILLFIDMAVVMLAQRYVGSSLVAIVSSSTVIWITLLDAPMWKRNLRSPSVISALVTGFLGVTLLYVEQLNHSKGFDDKSEYGILLLIFGCISWSLGTLYAKYRSSNEEEVNAFAGAAWQMLFAGLMFWICATVKRDIVAVDWRVIPVNSWLALTYLIVCGSIMAYSAYIWLLKVRPATEVGTHAYVNPFVAVVIGVTIGREDVTLTQIAGLAIILLSIMLLNRRK
ncbi:MAG: EamA family transporter [Tannerellaceae bacterium]|jgi:drug/metabolite transporter (DMT)-like permease|nr:EamA family transporter [Tannerellaceae bacterium]